MITKAWLRLTDERLAHILEHPEMVGMESAIEQTIVHPNQVVESISDSAARLYYRFYMGTMVGDKYLCVVVKIMGEEADRVKRGVLLWPKRI